MNTKDPLIVSRGIAASSYIDITTDATTLAEIYKEVDPAMYLPTLNIFPREVVMAEAINATIITAAQTPAAPNAFDPYSASPTVAASTAVGVTSKTVTWGAVGLDRTVPFILSMMRERVVDWTRAAIIEMIREVYMDMEYLFWKGTGSGGQPTGLLKQGVGTYNAGTRGLTFQRIVTAHGSVATDLGNPRVGLDGYLFVTPNTAYSLQGSLISISNQVQVVVTPNENMFIWPFQDVVKTPYGKLQIVATKNLEATGTFGTTVCDSAFLVVDPSRAGRTIKTYTFPSTEPVIVTKPSGIESGTPIEVAILFQPLIRDLKACMELVAIAPTAIP